MSNFKIQWGLSSCPLPAPMGDGTFFKVGDKSANPNKHRKFLWFEMANLTSQALKYDVNNFCQHA